MRRGSSFSTSFVIGLLLGIVLFLVALPLLTDTFKNSQESIDALQSCDAGLLATLAGADGEGKCTGIMASDGGTTQMQSEYPPPEGKEWMPIGKGHGCLSKTPYCWLLVPGKGGRSLQQAAEQSCNEIPQGSLAVVRVIDDLEFCFDSKNEKSHVSPEEDFGLRYYAGSDATCTYSFSTNTFGYAQTKGPLPCDQVVHFDAPVETIKGDKSILNADGGKLTVQISTSVPETKAFDVTIAKPTRLYCGPGTADDECEDNRVGPVQGGYCMFEEGTTNTCEFRKTYVCAQVEGDVLENRRVNRMPPDQFLESDERVCERQEFGPGQTKCKYQADVDGDMDEALFVCTRFENGICRQTYIASEDTWSISGDDAYDEFQDNEGKNIPDC